MTKIFIIFLLLLAGLKAENIYFDFRINKQIPKSEFLTKLELSKYILLGEQHDNSFHHDSKIEILDYFKNKNISIATEHLEFGKKILWQKDTKKSLESAKFDFKGWQWPVNKNLYDHMNQYQINVLGANLTDRDLNYSILNGKNFASLENLSDLLERFALDKNSQEILANELVYSHCGFIKKEQTASLQKMQLAKDITMSQTLMSLETDFVFLIAGNNHIRKDFAIPKILEKSGVHNYIAIGFFGKNEFDENRIILSNNFDLAVITKDVEVVDYCKNLKAENFRKFHSN